MKKLSKKGWIVIGCGSALLIALLISIIVMNQKSDVTFYVNKKECSSFEKKMEYKNDLKLNAKTLKVSATLAKEDISKQLQVKEIKVNTLKKYTVTFSLKDREETFKYVVNVVDTTAPRVEGTSTYEVLQYQAFTKDQLLLQISDNFDQEVKDISMKEIDTSSVREKKVDVIVKDSKGNQTKFPIVVNVKQLLASESGEPHNNPNSNVLSNPNSIAVLVNKENRLPDGWVPSDLVSIGGGHSLRSEAANACNSMQSAAAAEGIGMNVVSTYRTQSYQQSLYDNYFAQDPQGAPLYSAQARTSEHELGLAIDISYDAQLHDDLQKSSLGIWMANNGYQFGFIMRYPENKTDITKYMFEPWHYRYVGVSVATELKNKGITLEEYYSK